MPLIALPSPPRRILLIKPSALGDVVHTLPILNLLRRHWPDAEISWLVTPRCAGLLEGHPLLDEVILFDRRRFGTGWRSPRSLAGLTSFTADLARKNFDLVIDLQGLFRSGFLAWRTTARTRVGFSNARELAHLFYTHRVDSGPAAQHAIDRYLKLIEALGCPTAPIEFQFAITDEDRAQISDTLPEGKPYAVLLPGTNWATKRWPVEKFAGVIEPLKQRLGLETVLAGAAEDIELCAQLVRQAPIPVTNLAGKTRLRHNGRA